LGYQPHPFTATDPIPAMPSFAHHAGNPPPMPP